MPTSASTAGQIVGILGWRGVINSYANGPATTTIGGQSVTLRRFGMQFNLNTTNARDVWTENPDSISRVLFSYDLGINGNAVPEPSTYALTLSAVGLLVGLHARKRQQTQKPHSPSSTNS